MPRFAATLFSVALLLLIGVLPTSARDIDPPPSLEDHVGVAASWPADARVTGMTCPTATVCVTVGSIVKRPAAPVSVVARTEDGGRSWKVSTLSGVFFNTVACPSAAQCYVLYAGEPNPTRTVMVTRDGGKTWQTRRIPDGISVEQMACPAPTTCVLWGDSEAGLKVMKSPPPAMVLITRDSGATWQRSKTPPQGACCTYSPRLTCPTLTVCYAYGGNGAQVIMKSQDGGRTWRTLPGTDMLKLSGLPSRSLVFGGGLSCPSARVCFTAQGNGQCECDAAGPYGTIVRTQDGGKHWSRVYRARGRDFPTGVISCPGTRVCYALATSRRTDIREDALVLVTRDAGRTWSRQRVPALAFLSCPNTETCVGGSAPANEGYRTTNGGATWQKLSPAVTPQD